MGHVSQVLMQIGITPFLAGDHVLSRGLRTPAVPEKTLSTFSELRQAGDDVPRNKSIVKPDSQSLWEELFLSLRLMHGEEAHLLLALENDESTSLRAFARAVSAARNPEK